MNTWSIIGNQVMTQIILYLSNHVQLTSSQDKTYGLQVHSDLVSFTILTPLFLYPPALEIKLFIKSE